MAKREAIPVVIDTDVGADPDDAFALALALASPEIDVRGVTIVSGDVDLRARMAARLLGMAGRADIPVVPGLGQAIAPDGGPAMLGIEGQGLLDHPYHGPEATIQTRSAPEWLVERLHIEPFHLVTIGPLTNVAAALQCDPGLAKRLLGLTIMGGVYDVGALSAAWQHAIEEGGAAAWPDYNTMSDPEAALVCARSGAPITWITVETTFRAPLRRPSLERLDPEQPLLLALRRMTESWHSQWFRSTLPTTPDGSDMPDDTVAYLHDPLTVAALFASNWLHLQRAKLAYRIEDGLFRIANDPTGTPAIVSVGVDGSVFEAFCLERIARLGRG